MKRLTMASLVTALATITLTTSAYAATSNTAKTPEWLSHDVQIAASPKPPTSSSTTGAARSVTIPQWFMNDMKIANSVHFPILATNYHLDTTESPGYKVQWGNVLFGVPSRQTLNHDLIVGFTGGGIRFNYIFNMMKQNPSQYGKPSPIYVMESVKTSKLISGRLVPAMSIDTGGISVAFAKNQVIINLLQSGQQIYSVYSVNGITIPSL